jgi:hypothetical protein
MTEHSVVEFLMVSSGDGSFDHPSPRMCDTGASLAPITTTPSMENTLATHAMMTVPLQMMVVWPESGLSFE